MDPDDREALIVEPQPGDDELIHVSKFQAQKVACTIDAAMRGHVLWQQHAVAAVDFLHAAALEAGLPAGVVHPSAAERWARDLAHLPWPPSGPPKPQADA